MAFVDLDEGGDRFVNITHRVGMLGDWDDLLVVQALLDLVYAYNPVLKKTKPTKGPVTVTGKPAPDTSPLIAHFQKMILKRPKPQGYIDSANGPKKRNFTIWSLGVLAENILIASGQFHSTIMYLRAVHPTLEPVLSILPLLR